MLKWEAAMETGIATVDRQHQELVDKVNELMTAMKEGKGREIIGDVLAFLGNYAVDHFRTEETLMDRHKYPDADKHKAIHETFKADFGRLVGEYDANPTKVSLTIEVQRRVGEWLRGHILNVDKELGKYLAEKGAA